jgi:hypothetical protein
MPVLPRIDAAGEAALANPEKITTVFDGWINRTQPVAHRLCDLLPQS